MTRIGESASFFREMLGIRTLEVWPSRGTLLLSSSSAPTLGLTFSTALHAYATFARVWAMTELISASKMSPEELVEDGETGDENTPSSPPKSREKSQVSESKETPPLPSEPVPPLPSEAPPDDGWDALWDDNAQAYYFYNRFTQVTQWDNPRVPRVATQAPGIPSHDETAPGTDTPPSRPRPHGGYDPAIHGDYDPTAPYAQESAATDPDTTSIPTGAAAGYETVGGFNRWTGRWQNDSINPDNHNDENKSKRQMNAFFDVDAAANSHNGRSLKAERSGKKLSKQELKAFKEKRKEKKEEKRRAWLKD